MKYGRTFNFSAGPAMMPEPVLEEIRDEMMNYRGSGMCVMEMSHRSKVFQQIIDEAEADLRELMNIPDNYKVLFIQGGATLQFAAVAWNLMKNGKAVYIETGAWSKKAIAEAKKYGEVIVAASSKDKNYSYIPDCSDLDIPEDTDYVYICENETIHGVTWNKLPNTKGHVLVSDQSSMFLSKPCNVSDYGMIYAGVQKNVGPHRPLAQQRAGNAPQPRGACRVAGGRAYHHRPNDVKHVHKSTPFRAFLCAAAGRGFARRCAPCAYCTTFARHMQRSPCAGAGKTARCGPAGPCCAARACKRALLWQQGTAQ